MQDALAAPSVRPDLGEGGYVVIDDAIGPDTIARLRAELSPYLQGRLMGRNDFEGYRSERVYALLAKAPAVAELIEHPAVLEAVGRFLHPSYLLSAALVLMAARQKGLTKAQKEFVVFPGSGGVKVAIERPDPRLGGESIADVFRSVGGQIRASWCGPCFGQGSDALQKGQRAITSFNRNWQNRMGIGGEGYLASPAVVAASALAGYMAPPTELGLQWDAEKYGV